MNLFYLFIKIDLNSKNLLFHIDGIHQTINNRVYYYFFWLLQQLMLDF